MRKWTPAAVALVATLSACASSSSEPADPPAEPSSMSSPTTSMTGVSPTPSASGTPRQGSGTEVIVEESEFGPMLYGADGQAIYLFDLESSEEPRCYDECAEAWPPVLTKGQPVAGKGVDAGLLGATRRSDGSTQVTYAGHPLYFYAHEDPWQVLCHDFADFGGTWFVVTRDGDPAS
jgi:predicted lipoprotein with Yx(FWY)xxD motif